MKKYLILILLVVLLSIFSISIFAQESFSITLIDNDGSEYVYYGTSQNWSAFIHEQSGAEYLDFEISGDIVFWRGKVIKSHNGVLVRGSSIFDYNRFYVYDPIDIDVKEQPKSLNLMDGIGAEINIGQIMGGIVKPPRKMKKMTVVRAKEILLEEECDKLIDPDSLNKEAIYRAEQEGIIFIDEIDKIAAKKNNGQDVSREGVQRDILPIVEGSVVNTKYGVIHTDYILFIAAGAFHIASVNDLIPELQGRFPIQVELNSLNKDDFKKILTIPQNAITTQYQELLRVDNIELEFTEDAIDAIAELAADENETSENIGARRLQTIMEMLLEDISFNASDENPMVKVVIDKPFVLNTMKEIIHTHDFKKYVL